MSNKEQKHTRCPFCGGQVDPTGWLRGDGVRGPECESCGATAPNIDLWNQAAQPQGEPVYQLEYLGEGGGGWNDVDKATYDRFERLPNYRPRIVYAEQLAPASPQAAQPVADNSDWENTYGPDYEVDDVGSVSKVDTLLSVRDGYCRCGRLVAGHALSTHADAGEVQSPEYHTLAVKACKQEADIRALRAALLFYANRDHFSTEEMDAWDSCSGEPSNILWHEEEPWFIEDGEIARVALSTTAKPEADQ